jgi:hypothetical protein
MAKDKFHDHVREALEKDGWTITHDPFFIYVGRRRAYIDLGAEKSLIGAERSGEKIAVEIKSFLGHSDLDDFEDALGQFIIYFVALEGKDPLRKLYLAVPLSFYSRFFDDSFFVKLAERFHVKMLIFNEQNKEVVKWI